MNTAIRLALATLLVALGISLPHAHAQAKSGNWTMVCMDNPMLDRDTLQLSDLGYTMYGYTVNFDPTVKTEVTIDGKSYSPKLIATFVNMAPSGAIKGAVSFCFISDVRENATTARRALVDGVVIH